MSSRAAHIKGSILYFFLFCAYGCISPFLPLIWRYKGLSEHQVGLIGAVVPLTSFFVTPILCSFAERHSVQRQMLIAALLSFPIARSSVLVVSSFLAIALVEISTAVVKSPIGSLIDAAVIHSSGTDGYGSQRLWGAVGFGFATLVGGWVSDAAGGGFNEVMAVYVGFMAVAIVISAGLGVGAGGHGDKKAENGDDSAVGVFSNGSSRNKGENDGVDDGIADDDEGEDSGLVSSKDDQVHREAHGDGGSDGGSDELGLAEDGGRKERNGKKGDEAAVDPKGGDGGVIGAVKVMLGSTESTTFFAAVVLSGMGAGVIDTFLFIRVEELGGSHVLCGTARLIMCLAEVPFFYLSGPLIRKLGVRGVIALTELAYLVRFIYYSVLEAPWWVLPAEVLHGLTFAAMWAATTDYAYQISPPSQRSTLQGLVTGIHWGFGFGFGAIGGGVMYAGLGAERCFLVSAALPSTALLLLCVPTVVTFWRDRDDTRRRAQEPGDSSGAGSYELVSKGMVEQHSVNQNEGDTSMDDMDVEMLTMSTTTSGISSSSDFGVLRKTDDTNHT